KPLADPGRHLKVVASGVDRPRHPLHSHAQSLGANGGTPAVYFFGTLGVLGLCIASGVFDFQGSYWIHGGFAIVNGALILYAMVRFVGLRAVWEDLRIEGASPASLVPFSAIAAPETD